MTDTRVFISGLGLVSALGNTLEGFWRACVSGATKVSPIPRHWSNYYQAKSRGWSPLTVPNYAEYGLTRADELRYDGAVLNAIVAADDALADASINKAEHATRNKAFTLEGTNGDRVGVYIGSGLGCISSAFNNYVPHLLASSAKTLFADDASADPAVGELVENLNARPRVNPFASCQSMANSIAAALSIRYGARGPCETLIYACAAGTAAIARAFRAIQQGEVDVAIAGGSEYYGDRAGGVFMAFDRLDTLVSPCEPLEFGNRPFDRQRSGFLFSQGGTGILVLESEEHARRRAAHAYAEVRGMSITSDAHSLAAMSLEDNAIELMLQKLLKDSGLQSSDIAYINAHGTSTVQNDAIEAAILARVFPHKPWINSTKSLLGHTIGGSGAIECIATTLSMRDGKIHPSKNLDEPILDLNFAVADQDAPIEFAVTHNFGFGGHNVGLLLQNLDDR